MGWAVSKPSAAWVWVGRRICAEHWRGAVALGAHPSRCQQLGRLGPKASWVPQSSCWRDPHCTDGYEQDEASGALCAWASAECFCCAALRGWQVYVLICVCASSCDDWKYVLSLATGWTWGRGGAAASLLPGSWIQHVYYIQMHIRIIYSLKYTSTHIFISLYKYKPACIRKANIKHSKMWRIVSREGLERKRWLPQYFVRTEPNSQDDGDLAGTKTVLQFDIKVPPAQHQTCYGKALINQS